MPTHGKARLLVIDDDDAIREMYGDLFPEADYEVSTVTSLEEALALLEVQAFDLILTDLFGPYDQEALGSIARLFHYARQTPVLVVTARRFPDEASDSLPIRALIRKPFDLEVLMNVVALHLPQADTG